MAIGDLYELLWSYEQHDNLYQTKWHFVPILGGIGAADLTEEIYAQGIRGAIQNRIVNDLCLKTIITKKLKPDNEVDDYILTTGSGSHVPSCGDRQMILLDPALCVLYSLRTSKRGRAYRGRWYLGGVGDGIPVDGEIGNFYYHDYQDLADLILNDFGPSGSSNWRWVIWSPSQVVGGDWSAQVTQITSATPQKRFRYLKQRRFGHGS